MPPKKIKISRTPAGGKSIKGGSKRPQKGPMRPVPQERRDSSSSLSSAVDFSGDGGYSAVDDVSDSDDDDEEHVVAAEEEHIIAHNGDQDRDLIPSSPRPVPWTMFSENMEDDEAADADNDESDDDDTSASQQGMQSFSSDVDFDDAADESSDDSESWNGFSLEDEPAAPVEISSADHSATPVERRVRFAGVPDSDSESDETEDDHNEWFPDLFVAQQSLDPHFRREIEQDDDDDDNSSASFSYWDHHGAAEPEESSDRDSVFDGNFSVPLWGDSEGPPHAGFPSLDQSGRFDSAFGTFPDLAGNPDLPQHEEEEESDLDDCESTKVGRKPSARGTNLKWQPMAILPTMKGRHSFLTERLYLCKMLRPERPQKRSLATAT